MPVQTTTTVRTTSSGVAVHTISFRGLAGAIFVSFVVSTILYVIGFATYDWSTRTGAKSGSTVHAGLWGECAAYRTHSDSADWFYATQAMISIGLIGLLLCMILAVIYLCVHTVSKNTTILALVIICFLSVIFMLIGFCIYGAKVDGDLNWSFAITVIASIFCLVGGILAIVQMRKSGVRV